MVKQQLIMSRRASCQPLSVHVNGVSIVNRLILEGILRKYMYEQGPRKLSVITRCLYYMGGHRVDKG